MYSFCFLLVAELKPMSCTAELPFVMVAVLVLHDVYNKLETRTVIGFREKIVARNVS